MSLREPTENTGRPKNGAIAVSVATARALRGDERLEAWRTVRDEKKRNGLHLGREFRDGDVAAKRSILARIAMEIIVHERRPEIVLRAPFVHRTSPHGQAPEFKSTFRESGRPA